MTFWTIYELTTYVAAGVVITLGAIYIVPDLWREGLAIIRVWLTPDHPKVVSPETRERELAAAALGRRR